MSRAVGRRGFAVPLLWQRILSALVLAPALMICMISGGIAFATILAIGGLLMTFEFGGLIRLPEPILLGYVTVCAIFGYGLFVVAEAGIGVSVWYVVVLAAGGGLAALGLIAADKRLIWMGLGVVYVWVPVLATLWLRTTEAGWTLLIWAFLLVWGTDIGGYVVGRAIGGAKLAPRLSPNKTWAGLAGGIAFAIAGTVMTRAVVDPLPFMWMLVLTPVLAVWAQVGDIAESALKRHWGAKDSGRTIPGHGGILDRVDGLMFVCPLLALFTFILMLTRS